MSKTETETRPQTVVMIALTKLRQSEANARRTDKRADIESLAEDIAAHGVLQNLNVTDCGNGKYAVSAGGRRHAALKLLSKQGRIGKDYLVPCKVISDEDAAEVSLAENVQRVAMHAMDEAEAYEGLVVEGVDAEAISKRFGVTVRLVERRLALAALSPKVKAAFRKGEITLDAARAFCLTDDHAAHDAVLKTLSRPITSAQSVRACLTQGRVPAHDRLARFVGLDAYTDAGGVMRKDLFEENVVFLDDGELIRRLAIDKLDALATAEREKGWGWSETHLGYARFEGCTSERLRPTRRPLSDDEQTKLDAAEAALEVLDAALEDADEDDPRWTERDRLEAEIDEITTGTEQWDTNLIKYAGVVISVEHDGRANFAYGVIKRTDVKAIQKLQRPAAPGGVDDDDGGDAGETAETDAEPQGARLPRGVVEGLTTARTRALRRAVAESPHLGLALLVFVLARGSIGAGGVVGVEFRASAVAFDDVTSVVENRHDFAALIGGEEPSLQLCLAQRTDVLVSALAAFVAETIDLVHPGVTPLDRALQGFADELASIVDLDMTQTWKPDLAFWTQVPKAVTLAALATAPKLVEMSEKDRNAMLAAFGKMKKADLASAAAEVLSDADWLPDVLITPAREGALAVTAEGESAPNDLAAA
ncbi:MAG: ParB/RepB/Spo0J family partition protein [Hyphomonadaceae bacterium]|nr:ParB/RepB/Spo0J family partition protein [Hyphomonadaceae bacterium]